MDLAFRPALADDFVRFYFSCFPRDRTNTELRAIIEHEWRFLISQQGALTLVVEDHHQPAMQRIVACAQTVFVTESFAAGLRNGTTPWLNAHLARSHDVRPLLEAKELRQANSREGLCAVMTRWTLASELYDEAQALRLHNYLMEWFMVFLRGYNLKEVFVESTGTDAYNDALRAGFKVLNDYRSHYGDALPAAHATPCLFHLTREEAWKSKGSLASWPFAYTKPKYAFDFKLREQTLLRWALAGNSDPEIAKRLDLSIHSINKIWQSIYKQVETKALGLLPEPTPSSRIRGKRGHEKKRVLLVYLQDHPEELCPVDPKRP